MKICAVTMVYRDYWALTQWYRHYARHIGAEHLYVIAHGSDEKIRTLCPDSNVITVPRDRLDGFDRVRTKLLNGIQAGLSNVYDRVVRTDVDELICLDPAHHAGFVDLFERCGSHAVFALGFDLIEREGDADMTEDTNVFESRRSAIFSGHYSKAFAVSDDTALVQHGVRLPKHRVADYPFQLPAGVYLAHLRYANAVARRKSDVHRMGMASEGRGRPGQAWANADVQAERMAHRVSSYPEIDWDDAVAEAFDTISKSPFRSVEDRLVRAMFHQFKNRTTLPDWFASS